MKSFVLHHHRRVSFRDTAGCTLSMAGSSYRERTTLTAGPGPPPSRPRSNSGARTSSSRPVRFEGKATRNQSSRKTSQFQGKAPKPRAAIPVRCHRSKLADPRQRRSKASWIPIQALGQWLESLSTTPPQPGANLVAGPVFAELVFSKAEVDLGHDTDAEFDFTFWYPAGDASRTQPALVEISFGYDTDDGEVDRNVALRASKLFVAMQSELSALIAPGSQSKTSRALPSDCQEK